MPNINISADVLRIARMFLTKQTGLNAFKTQRLRHAGRYILVQPLKNIGGVHVVSTDGAVMCVQYDETGEADRDYVISPDDDTGRVLAHGINQDTRVVITDERLCVIEDDGEVIHTQISKTAAWVCHHALVGAGGAIDEAKAACTYPDWPRVVPAEDKLVPGYPGALNAVYLSILSRLYEEWNDARTVFMWHLPDATQPTMVARFPWRPGMVVLLAGMKDELLPAMLPFSDVVSPEGDDEDPAAGL
jgi:hypothetical protein